MNTLKRLNYKFHKVSLYEVPHSWGTQTWGIGTDVQMQESAEEEVKERIWCFNTGYIVDFLQEKNLDLAGQKFFDSIRGIQEKLNEDANPVLLRLIGTNIKEFIANSIKDDGRGSFLSSYDGQEFRTKNVPILNPGYGPLCFRVD